MDTATAVATATATLTPVASATPYGGGIYYPIDSTSPYAGDGVLMLCVVIAFTLGALFWLLVPLGKKKL